MTGPRIDPTTAPAVMSGAQWASAQSAPASALQSDDPAKATTNGLGRPLTGGEWSQAQRMTAEQVKRWEIPALPIQSDVTRARTRADEHNTSPQNTPEKGKKIDTPIVGAVMRQLVDPVLEHPLMAAPFLAAGVPGVAAAAPGVALGAAVAGGATAVHTIARYGWQKLNEAQMSPEERAKAEADPGRVSGEAAAVQAIMLGLAPLVHVGARAASRSLDFGAGMTEAGAQGVKETSFAPQFSDGFSAGQERSRFAAMLERGAQEMPGEIRAPKGFEATATPVARVRAKPVEGLVVPVEAKAGRVKPIETEPASAPLQEAADINASVRDYQAQRVTEDTQDIAAARLADAERLLGLRDDEPTPGTPRRRPGGAKAEPAPYFETPQGAEVLGAMASRHGLPAEANPYHPSSPLAPEWQTGHDAATQSYPLFPDGFSMGGAESRIPADYNPPKTPGFEPTALPVGATPETAQLAAALKPSRFRGHSTDELLQVARSARERIDQAQTVMDSEGAPPNLVTSAERAVTRANSTLAQVEREFALRGVTGDELARRIGGNDQTTNGLATVEGTGPVRTRGLAQGVADKALVNRLELGVGDLPEYRQLNMADQATRATALLADDPDLAYRVAKGEEPPPRGLLPESVFVAVENRAIAEGDVNTLRELAGSKLTVEATEMGRRIRALGERDPDSPVAAIQDVITTRSGGEKNAPKVAQATTDEVSTIRDHLAATPIEKADWLSFLDDLRC